MDDAYDEENKVVLLNANLPERKDETHNGIVGHYTGRCGKCGSSNLWDDNLSYGCNDYGRVWLGS